MKKTQKPNSYQHYLSAEFQDRRLRNPSYSLRAFARDLGVAAPKLSEILRGKCGLSEASATRLAVKLSLTEEESVIFINHVIMKHARKKSEREAARVLLESLKENQNFDDLTLETFKIIADWYHFAILELTEIREFEPSVEWIAKRLNIPVVIIQEAVDRLFEAKLLLVEPSGRWVQTKEDLAISSGVPSREIKKNHRQILAKADEALGMSLEERDFSSMTLAVPESQMEEIKREIKEFRRKLANKINEAENKDRVYCLSVQFFPLDKKGVIYGN